MERRTTEGSDSIVLSEEGNWAEWIFEVPEAGLYSVFPDYYPLEGPEKDILLTVSIDGRLPYSKQAIFHSRESGMTGFVRTARQL